MSQAASVVDEGDLVWTGADGNNYTYGKSPKKKCTRCPATFDWDGSEFKTMCKRCYGYAVRKCVGCKVANLKINAPLYQTLCTTCFIEKKQRTHKMCPRCPPDRQTHLRCPIGKDCCPECETRGIVMPPPNCDIVPLERSPSK